MRIGVVGTVDGWSSEKLADTVQKLTGFRLLVDMDHFSLDLSNREAIYGDTDLTQLDGLIIKKIGARYSPNLLDRLDCLRFLHESGLPVFSAPANITRVINRLSCTTAMCLAGIPMPETTVTEDVDTALRTVEKYSQAVFKPLYSSKARGMSLIQAGPGAREAIVNFKRDNPLMYIQKRIELNDRDLGLAFLGGKYLATYSRLKQNSSWNTTTLNGGKYAPYEPSPESIAVAEKAQSLFKLDFTCVDVVETANGPVVFEVSAFGGFRGIQDACGLDAAELYVNYVLEKLQNA
ncbi:MAG: GAK system ATP-grasp enzyme [Desulfonatronovibrionaceae bacterium]